MVSQISRKNQKNLVFDQKLIVKLVISISLIIFTSIFAKIKYFLPDNPVPITLQTFGVLLMGGILGPRWGLGSSSAYILLGIIGVPVFQGANSGFDYVLGVTGGYIVGFMFASFTVGLLINKGLTNLTSIWPYIIGTMTIYLSALIWLSVFDFSWPEDGKMLSQAVYPFLIGDFIKAIFASIITTLIFKSAIKKFI